MDDMNVSSPAPEPSSQPTDKASSEPTFSSPASKPTFSSAHSSEQPMVFF
jgi:hypothetical protein